MSMAGAVPAGAAVFARLAAAVLVLLLVLAMLVTPRGGEGFTIALPREGWKYTASTASIDTTHESCHRPAPADRPATADRGGGRGHRRTDPAPPGRGGGGRDRIGQDHPAAAPVPGRRARGRGHDRLDRKSTRLNSSHVKTSYAVFCLE